MANQDKGLQALMRLAAVLADIATTDGAENARDQKGDADDESGMKVEAEHIAG